jgi:hypothetical protein
MELFTKRNEWATPMAVIQKEILTSGLDSVDPVRNNNDKLKTYMNNISECGYVIKFIFY